MENTPDTLEEEFVKSLKLPTYQQLAEKFKHIAMEKSEWAGIPLPMKDLPMTLEPRYPYQFKICKVDDAEPYPEIRNRWYSERLRTTVVITEWGGKIDFGFHISNPVDFMINTMMAADAWIVEAEVKACLKLKEMIPEHLFRAYFMTGTFIQTSKRSGVTYIFRKLRPTIAFKDGRVLCGLCMHPIGFYQSSFAGAMVPTDDVIAHLAMMRGDEKKFWANSSQHDPRHPACAL